MREADDHLFRGQRLVMMPSLRAQDRYPLNPMVFRKQDRAGKLKELLRKEYREEIRKVYAQRDDRFKISII